MRNKDNYQQLSKTSSAESSSFIKFQHQFQVDPGQQVSPDKDIIPLCTCKLNGASFPKLVSTITFCQALDSVDGKVRLCSVFISAVERQCLEHLWNHENMFETGVVQANKC